MTSPAFMLLFCASLGAQELPAHRAAEWDRVALEMASSGETDAEMLAWLRALELEESDRRRRELGRLAATREGVRVTMQHGHVPYLQWLELSADGRLLLTSGSNEELRAWDATNGALLWTARDAADPAVSEGDRFVATVDQDRGGVRGRERVIVRETTTGRVVAGVELDEGHYAIRAVVDATGETLALVGGGPRGESLTIWDLEENVLLSGPHAVDFLGCLGFGPSGQYLLCDDLLWSRDGILAVDLGRSERNRVFAFDPRGGLLAVAGNWLHLFDLEAGQLDPRRFWVGDSRPQSLAFRPDGMIAAAGHGQTCVWDVETGALVSRSRAWSDLGAWAQDRSHHAPMALTADGSRCALGGEGDSLLILDMRTGRLAASPLHHGERVDLVEIASDARTVVTGSVHGLIRVWDISETPPPRVPIATRTPLVDRSENGLVLRWATHRTWVLDLETGERRDLGLDQTVRHVVFDPREANFALNTDDGQVWVFGVDGRRLAGPILEAGVQVTDLSGELLVTRGHFSFWCWNWRQDVVYGLPLGPNDPGRLVEGGTAWLEWSPHSASIAPLGAFGPAAHYQAFHDCQICAVDWEGRRLVLRRRDALELIDLRTRELLSTFAPPYGWREVVMDVAGQAVLVQDESSLWLWEADRIPQRTRLPEALNPGPLWLRGGKAVTLAEDGRAWVLDTEAGTSSSFPAREGAVLVANLDSTGRWLVFSERTERTESVPLSLAPSPAAPETFAPEGVELDVLAVTPDGRRVATLGAVGQLEFWERNGDPALPDQARSLPGGAAGLAAAGGKGVGAYLPAGFDEVRLTGPHGTWTESTEPMRPRAEPSALALDRDGNLLGLLRDDGLIHVGKVGSPENLVWINDSMHMWASGVRTPLAIDGNRALCVRDDRIVLFDLGRRREVANYDPGVESVSSLLLDVEADLAVVGGEGGRVCAIGLRDRLSVTELAQFRTPVLALTIGPDDRIVAATGDGVVHQVNEKGDTQQMLSLARPAAAICWQPAGTWTIVYDDGQVDTLTLGGEFVGKQDLFPRPRLPNILLGAWDAKGEHFAVARPNGSVDVWSVSGRGALGLPGQFRGHGQVTDLGFVGDPPMLVVGDLDSLHIVDPRTKQAVGESLEGWPRALSLDAEGGWAATANRSDSWSDSHRVVDLVAGETLWKSRSNYSLTYPREVLDFHASEDLLRVDDLVYTHLILVEETGIRHLGTRRRPLGAPFVDAEAFLEDGRVVIALRVDRHPAEPVVMDVNDPGPVRLEGDPSALRRRWEPRLGWTIEDGRLVERR